MSRRMPPLHPAAAAVAIGAFVCSAVFDVLSQVADTQYLYAQGAYALQAVGLVAGVVAALLGVADLARVQRGTAAFRTGVRHMLLADVVLVVFAASALWRRSAGTLEPPTGPMLALTAAGDAVLVVAVGFGALLVHRHRVGDMAGPRCGPDETTGPSAEVTEQFPHE